MFMENIRTQGLDPRRREGTGFLQKNNLNARNATSDSDILTP
jgi:hypothetical protein